MLPYFPSIYPDELLYSVLARWLRHQGAVGMTHPLEHLFGLRFASASLELPSRLAHLADALPLARALTADDVIDQLTLFPYYAAYAPESLRTECRRAMCAGAVSGLHMRLGLTAFRVRRVRELRFCSECVQDMRKRYGELYWKRNHQLPGVLVCPDHGCALQLSNLQLNVRGRFEYVAATPAECSVDSPRIQLPRGEGLARLIEVARRSAALLVDPGEARDFAAWTAHYRLQMSRAGLAWSPRRMRQAEMLGAFQEFYGAAMKCLIAECNGIELGSDWLTSMVRKHRKVAHPLQHILLQAFLDHRAQADGPFGLGPWPCCNPLAPHVGAMTVSSVARHRNRGHDVGVFACPCGYVYTRRFVPTSGVLEPPRVRRFGPLLDAGLRRLVDRGLKLRPIARALGVDPKTVARRAHELCLGVAWKNPGPARIHARRSQAVVEAAGRKIARVSHSKRQPRRDWTGIDEMLAARIHDEAGSIRKLDPPHRVTPAELQRRLGGREWISKRLRKLPRCAGALAREAEDVVTFRDRRVQWAVQCLYEGSTGFRLWELAKRAGVSAAVLRDHLLFVTAKRIP